MLIFQLPPTHKLILSLLHYIYVEKGFGELKKDYVDKVQAIECTYEAENQLKQEIIAKFTH